MKTNPLLELQQYGQSFWLDNINRPLITSGELQRLVEEDGLRGVTSNPTIFEQAITGSDAYDEEFTQAVRESKNFEVAAVTSALTTSDIRYGCDILRSSYEKSEGHDGYVCLEVGPQLAHETAATIEEARTLHARVNKPNLMIKVPATPEGIPAIERLISEGISVNITLMFSFENYVEVAEAYLRGLEQRLAANQPIDRIASVASVFVSRVDTKVDKMIEAKIKEAGDESEQKRLQSLLGKIAIANSKVMYQKYEELFGANNQRWQKLSQRGANAQRLLWASTSTKNPNYPDTYYVEALIGPDTVDTMPPKTVEAFRDHGRVAATLKTGIAEAHQTLQGLAAAGIDLTVVTQELQDEGVVSFVKSFENLAAVLTKKHDELRIGSTSK